MRKTTTSFLAMLLLTLAGCKEFEEFQTDPNRTSEASPDLLLTGLEFNAFNEVTLSAGLASRYITYTQSASSDQYYGWQRSDFNHYNQLRQVLKMEEEAARTDRPVYLPLAKFFRSWFIIKLTQVFGDVPYSQAVKGDEQDLFEPEYDAQEAIYLDVLDQLKAANQELATTPGEISGDIIYQGDIEKWRKLVNSFSLRILISLSGKEGNDKLQVIQRFREIAENPETYPLFASNEDQAQLRFYDQEDNRYPYFNNNSIQTDNYLDQSFVNMLQLYNDPRLFTFADRKPVAQNLPEDDFDAYGGLKGSESLSENTRRAVAGEASRLDERYFKDPVNEPCIALGYAELQFILAEAVVRGWINGNADDYYKNGITASQQFYGISQQETDAYLSQPVIQLPPGEELELILKQKYIACFMNSGWQPFYEQRRTGIPGFDTDGAGILNDGRIPKRWMYPESEFNLNRSNVEAAVARQYDGRDNINGEMWLLKEE